MSRPQERERFIKLGKPLGSAIHELITIVSPRTFARWLNGETKPKADKKATVGRPRTEQVPHWESK